MPLIPIAKELIVRKHEVCIFANSEIKDIAKTYSIPYYSVGISVRGILSDEIGQKMLHAKSTIESIKIQASATTDRLLEIGKKVYQGVNEKEMDLLITNERYFLFVQAVAERVGIPMMQLSFQPKGITSAYRYPYFSLWFFRFMTNLQTHIFAEKALIRGLLPVVNKLRKSVLKIPTTSVRKAFSLKKESPIIQGFSPAVFPKPSDWSSNSTIAGYWPQEKNTGHLPEALIKFLTDDKPKIYIGFGSMVYPSEMLKSSILDLAHRLNVKVVWSLNWSIKNTITEGLLNPNIYVINESNHEQLFPKVDYVIHHGGAGTFATAVRHAKPQAISFFMLEDQSFWAQWAEKLSIGINLGKFKQLTACNIIAAIQSFIQDPSYIKTASDLRDQIQKEDGVKIACDVIESSYKKS